MNRPPARGHGASPGPGGGSTTEQAPPGQVRLCFNQGKDRKNMTPCTESANPLWHDGLPNQGL